MAEMSDAAKQARREYINQWRKKNPDKLKEYERRHWEKVARQAAEEEKAAEK